MAQQGVILVTGATGNVGRQVVSQLLGRGAAVRALARDPGSADLPRGVEVVRGDLLDPDTLDAGLDGVESVFLVWPLFTAEGAPEFLDVVRKHARRVVYLSAMGVPDDPKVQTDTVWATIERLIEQSGVEWTFLRAGGFAANTRAWAEQIRTEGVVRWVYGAAARSLIHESDIAAVAVAALAGDGHVGVKYVLTGPETLSQVEQVHTIGEVVGRPVRWEEISPQAARQQLLAEGWSASFVDGALDAWAAMVKEPEPVTSTVEAVTGVAARTFREWAIDHADGFRSSPGTVVEATKAVADEYVSLCRLGRFEEAMERFFPPDHVRVEQVGMAGPPVEMRGVEAVEENSQSFVDLNEIHGFEVEGPFLGGDQDRFAARFAIDTTSKATGERSTITKISLYTVQHGKVVREEVYYKGAGPFIAG